MIPFITGFYSATTTLDIGLGLVVLSKQVFVSDLINSLPKNMNIMSMPLIAEPFDNNIQLEQFNTPAEKTIVQHFNR